jgi:hypothetical protein
MAKVKRKRKTAANCKYVLMLGPDEKTYYAVNTHEVKKVTNSDEIAQLLKTFDETLKAVVKTDPRDMGTGSGVHLSTPDIFPQ